MIENRMPTGNSTQIADQLLDVVNELLEIGGETSAQVQERLSGTPAFRAEMRRYHANGEFVDLSEIEARILEALLRDKGTLVSKTHLCHVLDLDPDRQERNLKSYVYRLRAKLNRLHRPGLSIKPIHGAGYVLTEVREDLHSTF